MRWIVRTLLGLGMLAALFVAALAWLGIPSTGAGLVAKNVCSGVFVAGREPADVLAADVLPASGVLRFVDMRVDAERRQARGRMLWSRERTATLLPGLGCVLDPTPDLVQKTLPVPAGAAGSAREPGDMPEGDILPTDWRGIDRRAIDAVVHEAFRTTGEAQGRNTRAVVILHRGLLVAQRHAPGFDGTTPQLGWSMSKTVLGLLVYMKLEEQRLQPSIRALDWVAPDRRPQWLLEWEGDERRSITLADLLFMRDGLKHDESYEPWSSVPRMLWGVDDVPGYAGSAPADAPPGQRFRYLSATTNILSRLLRAQFESDDAYWRYPRAALFDPIGARSAVLESDAGGTFIASSYLWATPFDWARIGEVLRRDGMAGERRVFPSGWQRFAAVPPPSGDAAAMAYGAHVWLAGARDGSTCGPSHGLPADTFLLAGHAGQLLAVIPSREAVVVRLGMTLDRSRFDRCAFIRHVVGALPLPAGPETSADAPAKR